MRVTHLELENIKSYAEPTRIELTSGVNAICGLNGSGKTTILEAIGFALFDFLPYTQTAFLREGERSGTIRLGVVGRDDREYEVVRRVGTGAAYFVSDVETGTKIADRGPAVLDWIRRQALNLDGEADLGALFKNAVGVPQGLMTSDFQGTPTTRKSIFDPLLRVEEYRAAYEYLRETVSHLKARTAQIEGEISMLAAETEAIPAKIDEIAIRANEVEEGRRELASLEGALRERETQKGMLDETQARLRDLDGQVRDATYVIGREQSLLTQQEEQLEAAREAAQVVAASEAGYQLVQAARLELERLEGLRTERDEVNAELSKAQARRREHWGAVQSLDKQLTAAVEAARDAEELRDAVAQQTELESRLQEIRAVLREGPRLTEQLTKLRAEMTRLEQRLTDRDAQLGAARDASQRAEKLPAVHEELAGVLAQLSELQPLKQQRDEIRRQGTDLKDRRVVLLGQQRKRAELASRLEAIRPMAARLEELTGRETELRDRHTWITAAIEYQELARKELNVGTCPLLELQCPVVTADPDALARFTARHEAMSAELAEVTGAQAAIHPEVDAARTAAEESRMLDVELARLEGVESELSVVEEGLRLCLERHRDLSDKVASEGELAGRRDQLQARVTDLGAAVESAAQIPVLDDQQKDDREALALVRQEIENLEGQQRELEKRAEDEKRLESELRQLDGPRERQQGHLAVAARKPQIEAALLSEQTEMNDAAAHVKARVAELQRFETLDEEMEAQRAIRDEHLDEHDAYLRNQTDAAQLDQREAAVTATQEKLRKARARHAEVTGRRDEVAAGYDEEQHNELTAQCHKLNGECGRARATVEHLQGLLERAQEDLADLRRQEEKLRAREGERARLDRTHRAVQFVRETIKAAGPAITESLLANISEGANEIFAEIMDDHAAELRWDRDYDVVVQRGTEERKFVQLSGGEQMSAALAVRLALLKEMSEVDFAFFDEPTQNMDAERRTNLAGQVRQVRGFDQLIVISHDDTFEHHTDNLIRLQKEHEATTLEA